MSLRKTAAQGAAWQLFSVAVQAVLNLALYVLVARASGPAELGALTAALLVVGFTNVIAEAGFPFALIQKADLDPADAPTAFWLNQGWAWICVVAIILLARPIATLLGATDAIPYIIAVAFTIPINGAAATSLALLERTLRFDLVARIHSGSYVLSYGVVGITAALLKRDPWALVYAFWAKAVITLAWSTWPVFRTMMQRPSRHSARGLLRFGGSLTIGRVFDYAAWQVDSIIVAASLGPAALAIYQRAFELMELPGRFVGKVSEKVLFSGFSRIQEDQLRLRNAVTGSMIVALAFTAPVAVLIFFYAEAIILLLYGDAWLAVVPALRFFAAGIVFRTAYRLLEAALRARGSFRALLTRKAIMVVTVAIAAAAGVAGGVANVAALVTLAIIANTILLGSVLTRDVGIELDGVWRVARPVLLLTALTTIICGATSLLVGTGLLSTFAALAIGFPLCGAAIALMLTQFPFVMGREFWGAVQPIQSLASTGLAKVKAR